ncbi:MAG TPA: AAA family ATPase [Euzebya sp.]|nr:AAA family ATPase [Euzebya sp.]
MGLPTPLQSLLEHTEAEAKRFGQPEPSVLHLLRVLHRRNGEVFTHALGADATARLDAALAGGGAGDAPAPAELLLEASRGDPSEAGILGLLKPHFDRIAPTVELPAARIPSTDEEPTGAQESDRSPSASPSADSRHQGLLDRVIPDPALIGRGEVVQQLLTVLGRRQPGTPCLVGDPGIGRTSTLTLLAAALETDEVPESLRGRTLYRLVPEACLVRGRADAIKRVADDLEDAILAIDDLEVVAALGGRGADIGVLGVIRSIVGSTDLSVVLTVASPYFSRLAVHDAELESELEVIRLDPLGSDDLRAVVAAHAAELADHHQVTYPPEVLVAATAVGTPAERAHPGLLVDRLDHAGTVASLRSDRTAQVADLGLVVSAPAAGSLADLDERLKQHVRGQDQAVSTVAARLALTRNKLDLRPERPDGVFLFAGPTGVGKTALARALCVELFGDESRLIRLDMSEFMHDWAVTRLIGPAPGYVGSDQPEEWLTTKVREQPDAVVLLDEIEKAHPRLWTTFLQVFDAGRLTDLRGEVSFADTVIVLTTNLGAGQQQSTPVGFTERADDPEAGAARAYDNIRDALPPELFNRLDGVVVFHALGPMVIREIAELEIAGTITRLAERGYVLTVDEDVIDHIAVTGYDPAYGARHLQRNIEKLLLEYLVAHTPGPLRARLVDGQVLWSPEQGRQDSIPS